MPGGAYKPLGDRDIERIHDAALHVLETLGIGDPIPEILEYALPKGCTLGDDGRLRFPRSLVEDMIAISAKEYVLHAPDPAFDHEIKDERVIMTTSGEAVRILDYETQRYRPTTLVDLYDAARLADRMEHIHNYGQPFIAADWSHDVYTHDMNIGYAALAGTRKAFALGIAVADHIDPLIRMFDLYAGHEGAFLERPFCTFGGCPIVSPLRFGKENAEVLVKVAKLGLTGDVAIAAQAGATAPAALAGALVQTFAETLACLTVMNLIRPGSVMNFGMWPFISDLRTGAFSGGSGEEALVIAAMTQLANHYGFITSAPSGMTDAKTMDAQAGYEKAITTLSAALAGANMVCAYPGIWVRCCACCGASKSRRRPSPSRSSRRWCSGRVTSSTSPRPSRSCKPSTSTRRSPTAAVRETGTRTGAAPSTTWPTTGSSRSCPPTTRSTSSPAPTPRFGRLSRFSSPRPTCTRGTDAGIPTLPRPSRSDRCRTTWMT
jgi:trimethylamine--corrinoid protein Co-methyltransferase